MGQEQVESFLAHYASKYYDPVKAKEYYERTKELKGREKKLTSDTQKEAWGYASNQISEQRKAAKDSAADTQKAKMEAIRAEAEASKTRILEGLKARIADIMKTTPIPENASPRARAYLEKMNAQRQQRASREAQAELKKLGDSIRTALKSARDSYAGVQKGLDEKFKKDREQEYENIRTKIT